MTSLHLWLRLPSAAFSAFMLIAVYVFMPPVTRSPYIFCIFLTGLVPLFDLTLSVGAANMRHSAPSTVDQVRTIIFLLSIIVFASSTVTLCVGLLWLELTDSDLQLFLEHIVFFILTSVFIAVSNALPLFGRTNNYERVLVQAAMADAVAVAVVLAGFVMDQINLALFVAIRLVLFFVAISVGARANGRFGDSLTWLRNSVRERFVFLSGQLLVTLSGALIYSLPGIYLAGILDSGELATFGLSVAVANFATTFIVTGYSTRNDYLAACRSSFTSSVSTMLRKLASPFVTYVFLFFLGVALLVATYPFLGRGPSPTIAPLIIAGASGSVMVCSQLLALSQRVVARDRFSIPQLIVGAISLLFLVLFAEGAESALIINFFAALAILASGIVLSRKLT